MYLLLESSGAFLRKTAAFFLEFRDGGVHQTFEDDHELLEESDRFFVAVQVEEHVAVVAADGHYAEIVFQRLVPDDILHLAAFEGRSRRLRREPCYTTPT